MYTFYTFPFIFILIFAAVAVIIIGTKIENSLSDSERIGAPSTSLQSLSILSAMIILTSPLIITVATNVISSYPASFTGLLLP